MEKEAFAKYLEERYYDQMKFYDNKAGLHKKRYREFQWILIILSALTPVLAALDGKKILGEEVNLQIIVVISAAIVAILTSGLKTFQYQELWTSYRLTQELLKPEIYYYQFNVGPYGANGIDKESLFVSRVESILDKEHAGWPASKKQDDQDNGEQTTDHGTSNSTVVIAADAGTEAAIETTGDTNTANSGSAESNSATDTGTEEDKKE